MSFSILIFVAAPLTAFSHGFAGDRFFPATLTTDDPFAASEMSLDTFSEIRQPGQPPFKDFDNGMDISVLILPLTALTISDGYSVQKAASGGEQEKLDADELQLAEKVDISLLTLQVGRFSVTDEFDNNAYAHDSRGDFLNWAAVDALAFDYAVDALGFEEGLSLELNQKTWAARWGIFTIPHIPNVNGTDGHYLRSWQQVAELEGRYSFDDHPGKVRLLGYLESAPMGSYKAAVVDYPSEMPDIADTRRYRYTYGVELNTEQEITKDLGAFLRLAMRDPNYEAYQFSDASRSLEIGLSLKGTSWKHSGLGRNAGRPRSRTKKIL